MKRELERALKAAGSINGLARKLRRSPSTIRRWMRDGVPKKGDAREALLRYKEERKRERARIAQERKEARRLMEMAKEKTTLPDSRTSESRRDGPLTSGYRWTKGIRRMLSLTLIDDIEVWAQKLRRRFPLWQIVVSTSQFSFDENFKGYEVGTTQVEKTPEARAFAQDVEMPSPRNESKSEVLYYMRGSLEDAVETPGLTVFVHSVTMYNYRLRTSEERRAYETQARYRRKQKWKKRQKASAKAQKKKAAARKKARRAKKATSKSLKTSPRKKSRPKISS